MEIAKIVPDFPREIKGRMSNSNGMDGDDSVDPAP
jgi:hypothetical protein